MTLTLFLLQEEGEYYNVPVVAEGEDITDGLKKQLKIQTDSCKPRKISQTINNNNITSKDAITVEDFNFLMVLGKGSFGKVKVFSSPSVVIVIYVYNR